MKYELGRAAGAFESLGSIKSRELNRLADKGMNATAKLSLMSRDYLPRLCDIIHRGLTLEEVRLLTGTSEDELRAALRRPIVRRTTINTKEETNRDDWINIAFIFSPGDRASPRRPGGTDERRADVGPGKIREKKDQA